jgi:hypothetical protein
LYFFDFGTEKLFTKEFYSRFKDLSLYIKILNDWLNLFVKAYKLKESEIESIISRIIFILNLKIEKIVKEFEDESWVNFKRILLNTLNACFIIKKRK